MLSPRASQMCQEQCTSWKPSFQGAAGFVLLQRQFPLILWIYFYLQCLNFNTEKPKPNLLQSPGSYMSVLMDKNLKSDLILFAAICFPPVSLFWLNHCSTTCIEQSCIRVKEHLPITDQNVSWTWGSLASAGQHFKCSMATLGAQLHPYLISSPTSLISPTTNTELMVSALPRIQTDPNTSSLPKMQLQAVASSSAKIFPANQPGHISKCKCHRQTFRASLKSPILAWMKSSEKACPTI